MNDLSALKDFPVIVSLTVIIGVIVINLVGMFRPTPLDKMMKSHDDLMNRIVKMMSDDIKTIKRDVVVLISRDRP